MLLQMFESQSKKVSTKLFDENKQSKKGAVDEQTEKEADNKVSFKIFPSKWCPYDLAPDQESVWQPVWKE